jgi:DNA polymerase
MRNALTALSEELWRLKSSGVRTVSVSDDSLAKLRAIVVKRSRPAGPVGAAGVREEKPAGPIPPVVILPQGAGKKVVLGVGNLDAQIMFIGEAPGSDEEVQGEPFVGPAGQLLNRMIAAMGIQRSDVYIGNIMNWRPQLPVGPDGIQVGNRPPTPDEMAYCMPYLLAQIDIVSPAILVALGATAAQGLLGSGTFKALGEVRGQWRQFAGRPLMVTYHPSYILRSSTNRSKRLIWEDLLKVMERARLPISEKQKAYFLGK